MRRENNHNFELEQAAGKSAGIKGVHCGTDINSLQFNTQLGVELNYLEIVCLVIYNLRYISQLLNKQHHIN